MAIQKDGGLNQASQAEIHSLHSEKPGLSLPSLHQRHYDAYLNSVAGFRVADTDDLRDAMNMQLGEHFDCLVECPSSTLADILLKVRAAQHQAVNTTEASVVSPRVYGELLGIIAADIEVVMHLFAQAEG